MRQKWQIEANTDAARVNDAIGDKARALGKQANTVAFDNSLETQRRIYVDPNTTDDEKAQARAAIDGSIATGLKTGLLTPDQADARRKQYIENADFSRAKLAVENNPDAIIPRMQPQVSDRASTAMGYFQSRGWTKEQAAGIVGNLIAESRLDTGAIAKGDGRDGSDSVGIGQWNGDRAAALKNFAAERGADWHDFGTQLAFVDHELKTSEKDAGDQIRNAGDVKSATEAAIMYERPAGSQNGAQFANNYKGRLTAATQAAGEDVNPDWFKRLSPEEKQVVYQQQETRQKQLQVEQRGNIETAIQNAPAAIQSTGTYSGSVPTQQQFVDAYGAQEGQQKFNNFSASLDAAQTAFNFRTMSASEIQQAVEADRPTSSGDDAAAQEKRFEAVSTAATQTLAARKADPATYTMQAFPSVQQAWNDAATSGNYQNAMAATAAAQQQLGMQKLELLPKGVADQAVTTFKSPDATDQQRIGAVSSLIFATPDQGQRQAVFNQLVDAGLPAMTEGVMEAAARGDSGAANRLLQAALTDPSKLPRSGDIKPTDIDNAVYSSIWAPGQVGDAAYGISYGDASSLERAQRGSELMKKAVQLRISQGQDLDTAVAGASKDLFGDVKVYSGSGSVSANMPVPKDTDTSVLTAGLDASKTAFKAALDAQRERIIAGSKTSLDDGSRAILETTTSNRMDDILNNGVFVQAGNGVGLRDPYTGGFVMGTNGQPLTLSLDKIMQMGTELPRAAAPEQQYQQGQAVTRQPDKEASQYLSGQQVTQPMSDAAKRYLSGQSVDDKNSGGNNEPRPFDNSSAETSKLSSVERGFLSALSTAESAGIGGTKLKLYNDIIQRGRTAPITESDLQPDEREKLKALVLKQGKSEGKIDYKDYLGSGLSEDILGGFRYKVDDNGEVHITDTYDFNKSKGNAWDDSTLMQALAAFTSPKNLAAEIGRKMAPDSKPGIPVRITLK